MAMLNNQMVFLKGTCFLSTRAESADEFHMFKR